MKTQFWTRKGYIGLLMTLVLALGVQGIADALTLTHVSDRVQSNLADSTFEITFSVGLKSDTTPIKDNNGKLINDSGARIDAQGYLVTVIDGKDYRNTTITADNASNLVPPTPNTPARPSGLDVDNSDQDDYVAYTVHEKVSSSQYVSYSGAIYANSSKSAFSNRGYPLYYYTPAFMYDGSDADTDEDDTAAAKVSPQIKIRDEHFATRTPTSNRYHYNDEAIAISVSTVGSDGSLTSTDNMSVRLKSGSTSYPVNAIGVPETRPGELPTEGTASLWEGGGIRSLPSSITLICTSPTAGTYTVTITDVSHTDDFPNNAPETLELAQIAFTLYVEDDAAPTGSLNFNEATGSLLRLDTAKSVEPIHTHFALDADTTNLPANTSIRYKVTKGSGLLYVGTPTREDKPPTSDLTIHKSAMVYLKVNKTDNEVVAAIAGRDLRTHGKTLVFAYTGTDRVTTTTTTNQQNQQNQQQTSPNRLGVSLSGSGNTRTVTVSALAAGTTSTSGIFTTLTTNGGTLSPTSGATPLTSTWTLPSTAGTYTVSASTTAGYTSASESVTVTVPGTLTAVQEGQLIRVTANPAPSSNVAFTLTRGGARIGGGEILTAGWGRAIPTGLTTGSHILTVNATGYNATQVSFTPGATTTTTTDTTPDPTTPTTPTTTTPTVSEPSSLQIAGQSTRSGTANTALDAPLLVRVLDDDGDAVAETRVIFRVRTGQGRLSERGNGRAIALQTDTNGYARAPYTPISASSTVEAEASGVTRRVTFTITASGGAATPTTRDTDTGSDTISPVVHTAAAKRPPMLWVDNGAIYALVDTDVQRFAPTVDNALSLAIGGDTVYWTEKTGDSAGTINSAHLDGTGIKELKAIMAVPMGITVDTTANLLYWTNSRGRIQSLNADGSGRVENVLQNLTSPLDIGLAGGNVYWTHSNGGIGFASLKGQKQVRNISNGADAAGSLVIGGGKVYWTEETGENGGRIKSANLNGSGITDVASIFAVPIGIGLDSSRGKLFWTNSRGRIQSSDLEGNGVSNVVDGLGHPGDMVLSNSIAAPAATTTTTTTTADNAKYDVNGDGTVDNMDAGLVSEAMGTSNAKYDVNNDGTVNFLDLLLVFDNRDEGAASAPTVLGMQLTAVQIDVLQEQIDLLIATGDRSPAAMRTLIYLQQLIATARPEQTQLLANYPNPFNPETWIPYELATDTDVRLTIYNTHGAVIRTLQLGHQSAGYYVGRDRAAYWDGRNAFGEQVASGIYFYQLETDAMSLMRKMVILK